MIINFITNFENKNSSYVFDFISENILFNFIKKEFKDLNNLVNENNFVLVSDGSLDRVLKKENTKNRKIFSKTIFLLKEKHSYKTNSNFYNIIYYPIHWADLEKKITSFFSQKVLNFKSLVLTAENSSLINKKNKKQTYLTETEYKILESLIVNKKNISKNLIYTNILKYSKNVESKTLDVHIYRLRKKLIEIDSTINIGSDRNSNIFLN